MTMKFTIDKVNEKFHRTFSSATHKGAFRAEKQWAAYRAASSALLNDLPCYWKGRRQRDVFTRYIGGTRFGLENYRCPSEFFFVLYPRGSAAREEDDLLLITAAEQAAVTLRHTPRI